METVEAIQWLRDNNLYEQAQNVANELKKIFINCLGISNERILIIGDKGMNGREIAPILACGYYLSAQSLNLNAKLVIQEPKSRGNTANIDVRNSIGDLKENNVISLNLSDRLGNIPEIGKSFRKFCIKKKFKFISTLGLGSLNTQQIELILSAMDLELIMLKKRYLV